MKILSLARCFLLFGLGGATSSTFDQRCLTSHRPLKNEICWLASWQFNPTTRTCEPTCNLQGAFTTKGECNGFCRSTSVCISPRPKPHCALGQDHPVYYYDPIIGSCLKGRECTYAGNNFPTLNECQATCLRHRPSILDPCHVAPSEGHYCPSGRRSYRFYFSPDTRRCHVFWYDGCGGTRNNFRTYYDCRRRCARIDPQFNEKAAN
nr:BPTI/Kunitz domain-containing protein 5-like [Dermacentor andersoni]